MASSWYFSLRNYKDDARSNKHKIQQTKLLLTDSLYCPSGLHADPFSFQLLSARWSRCTTTHLVACALMDRRTYIDDFVAFAKHDENIITIFFEVTSLMNTIHLLMYKWVTNSNTCRTFGRRRVADADGDTSPRYGLGHPVRQIHIDHTDITRAEYERPAPKRQVLHFTSRFYDPLGLFSPVAPVGKLHFQDTRTRELAWDEILLQDNAVKWLSWTSQFHLLSDMHVPWWQEHRSTNYRTARATSSRCFRTCKWRSYIAQVHHWQRHNCPNSL